MAKGTGFYQAFFASLQSLASLWHAELIESAGLDLRVCPVCGSAERWSWESMAECWHCSCTAEHPRRAIIEAAAKAAGSSISIEIKNSSDQLVARSYDSRKMGIVWNVEIQISAFTTAEELPPMPQGLKVVYPAWWPTLALAEFDAQQEIETTRLLAQTKARAIELGIKLGRDNVFLNNWKDLFCEVCGDKLCSGAQRTFQNEEPPCQHRDDHPTRILSGWQSLIQLRQRDLDKWASEQKVVDDALASQGFFFGRPASARFPQETVILRSDTWLTFAVAPSLTVAQLIGVAKEFDGSIALEENGLIIIKTKHASSWIGRGGDKIKALQKAIGLRIKVIEVTAFELKPQSATPVAPQFVVQPSTPAKPLQPIIGTFGKRVTELDSLIQKMEEAGKPTCLVCDHELETQDRDVGSFGKLDRRLHCPSCNKQYKFPQRYLDSIQIGEGNGSTGGSFSFKSEGITTGTGAMKRLATPDEVKKLAGSVKLLGLEEVSPFKIG